MPKSKRSRLVHTSSVQKRPAKERSATIFADVQTAAGSHAHVVVVRVANMRNALLQAVRAHFKPDSRLIFGRAKVMAKALGAGPEDEPVPGLAALAPYVRGGVGLLFTDRPLDEVREYLDEYSEMDYARAGARATHTVVVPAGVVYSTGGVQPVEDDVPMAHSQEVTVRKWGMPTRLDKGKVMLDRDWTLCEEGKKLNSHQTALLKLFGIPMAEFRIRVLTHWNAATGEVEVIEEDDEPEDDADEAAEDMDGIQDL